MGGRAARRYLQSNKGFSERQLYADEGCHEIVHTAVMKSAMAEILRLGAVLAWIKRMTDCYQQLRHREARR